MERNADNEMRTKLHEKLYYQETEFPEERTENQDPQVEDRHFPQRMKCTTVYQIQ